MYKKYTSLCTLTLSRYGNWNLLLKLLMYFFLIAEFKTCVFFLRPQISIGVDEEEEERYYNPER